MPATVDKERYYYTSIYFLLDASSPSHFHRLKHDELWYYHAGDPITIYTFYPNGSSNQVVLDPHLEKGEQLQYRIIAAYGFTNFGHFIARIRLHQIGTQKKGGARCKHRLPPKMTHQQYLTKSHKNKNQQAT